MRSGPPGLYARRPPSMSTGLGRARVFVFLSRERGRACRTLLSFERPTAGDPGGGAPHRTLKTANVGQFETGITSTGCLRDVRSDHRQDSKGTRWMPWHQESMKGVDGCDKPR
jgi:hypothetical protein